VDGRGSRVGALRYRTDVCVYYTYFTRYNTAARTTYVTVGSRADNKFRSPPEPRRMVSPVATAAKRGAPRPGKKSRETRMPRRALLVYYTKFCVLKNLRRRPPVLRASGWPDKLIFEPKTGRRCASATPAAAAHVPRGQPVRNYPSPRC